MKLIIDIPDKMFDTFKKHGIMAFDHLELGEYDKDQLVVAIANGTPYEEGPQGGWVRKEDVIYSIAKQYTEHNEVVPNWLSIGDMKGGAE